MKILQVNTVYDIGSTGKIVKQLQECAEKRSHSVVVANRFKTKGRKNSVIPASSWVDCHIHNRLATITGLQGCFSVLHTWLFLRRICKFSPDVIHLHNLHGNYINLGMLFRYIKKQQIPVLWTLHDCWAFTGGCSHFVGYSCDKWKSGCSHCPHFMQNKGTIFDFSSYMWKRKKKWFSGMSKLTLVCPSRWLASFVHASFLKENDIVVVPNGIDLNVFRPRENDFKSRYGLEGKKVVLGVSFDWNERKGVDVFVELANRLPEKYRIVLVGNAECMGISWPDSVLRIKQTANQEELAEIYSAADVFVNPSREENYPTVNMEALACGTPVVTFRTGGSAESIDESCGCVVDVDDVDTLEKKVVQLCESERFFDACLRKAKDHDMCRCYKEYMELYETIGLKRN